MLAALALLASGCDTPAPHGTRPADAPVVLHPPAVVTTPEPTVVVPEVSPDIGTATRPPRRPSRAPQTDAAALNDARHAPASDTRIAATQEGLRRYAAGDVAGAVEQFTIARDIAPTEYDVLWRLAFGLADLGDMAGDGQAHGKRAADWYASAAAAARQALAVRPDGADAHFTLARILGRASRTASLRARLNAAREVRTHAQAALAADPRHPGALHVDGVWHAEVMRLNGAARMLASRLLGGQILGEASWEMAQRELELAAEIEPTRIVHRLELGRLYADRGDRVRAAAALQLALDLPRTDSNDREYQEAAREALRRLR